MLSADKRNPTRPIKLEQREIEHIHHPTLEKGCVAAFGREKGGDGVEALVENEAIEATVDDIAHSAGKDECETEDERSTALLANQACDKPSDKGGGQDAENGKHHLTRGSTQSPPEGKAAVLNEMETAPGADEGDFLTYLEMGLDPNLDYLVNNQDGGGKDDDCACDFLIVHCGS